MGHHQKETRTKVTAVIINSSATTPFFKIHREEEEQNVQQQQQQQDEASSTKRSGVKCSTITISIDDEENDDTKSIKVDDELLKELIDSGSDIGINEIFRLW